MNFGFVVYRVPHLFIFSFFLLFLNGCAPFLLGAGVTGVAVVASQERTVGKIVDDNSIWLKLKSSYEFDSRFKNISVVVNEGRVLLTGSIKESLDRMNASKIAWEVIGVREVINELEIANQEKNFTESSWITAQIKLSLLMKSNVKSTNYSIETYNKVVYLMGIAQNKEELKKVIETVQGIPKVAKVISYVRLKSSDLRN